MKTATPWCQSWRWIDGLGVIHEVTNDTWWEEAKPYRLIQRARHYWMDFGPEQNIYWRPIEVDIERNEIDNIQQQSSEDETVAHNSSYLLGNLHSNTDQIKILSEEEKKGLVEINLEEPRKSRRVMGKMKRCYREFPHKSNYTENNFRNNAIRFEQEAEIIEELKGKDKVNGNEGEEVVETEERNLEWSLELKVSLIELETEARVLGKGHMMKLKEMWDERYPEYRNITAQSLRDNKGRFKKDPVLQNLILVRRQEMQEEREGQVQQQQARNPVVTQGIEKVEEQDISGTADQEIEQEVNCDESEEQLSYVTKIKTLETAFNLQFKKLTPTNPPKIEGSGSEDQ